MVRHFSFSTRLCALPILAVVGLSSLVVGQEGPDMTWGEVAPSDLKMQSYQADTNASAIVLFDYGEAGFNNEMGFLFTRHTRLKILSKDGYKWGTISVNLRTENYEQKISGIEGYTYTLAPDGTVQRTEFDDDGVFEEEYDKKYTRYKFTLPGLQPGCVIEYRYKIKQKSIFYSPDWEFQSAIPELWSEFRLVTPKNFSYAVVREGYEQFYINTIDEERRHFSGETSTFVGTDMVRCNRFRYVVKDAAAIREEPFMTTTSDYIEKVSLQLAEYSTVYTGYKSVIKSWDKLVEELMDDETVAKAIDDTKAVRRATEPLIVNRTTPEEKMQAIYDFVRTNIVWNGHYRWVAEQEVDEVLESRKGSSADITCLLLSMLRAAGVDGYQVILSTRGNGKIQVVYPILSQFNYIIAAVPIQGKIHYLDATDRFRPVGVLPTRVLNTHGLFVRKGPAEWVPLSTYSYYNHAVSASMKLSPSGEMTGSVQSIDNDYAAIARRKELEDGKEADVVKEMLGADRALFTVDSVNVGGLDSTGQPLFINAQITSPSYAEGSGDLLYVNPFVVERQYENPFKLPTRKYPVDMTYPREFSWEYTITLPDGYEVKEIPPDKGATVGSGEAIFTRRCKLEGRTLSMSAGFAIRRSEFPAKSYGSLKDFYEKVTSIESEQVVLKKKTDPSKKGT